MQLAPRMASASPTDLAERMLASSNMGSVELLPSPADASSSRVRASPNMPSAEEALSPESCLAEPCSYREMAQHSPVGWA